MLHNIWCDDGSDHFADSVCSIITIVQIQSFKNVSSLCWLTEHHVCYSLLSCQDVYYLECMSVKYCAKHLSNLTKISNMNLAVQVMSDN